MKLVDNQKIFILIYFGNQKYNFLMVYYVYTNGIQLSIFINLEIVIVCETGSLLRYSYILIIMGKKRVTRSWSSIFSSVHE